MPHLITKSLFVDYKTFSKLAWWRWNNLTIYRKIKKLETEEASEQVIELWKTVEKLVWSYLETKTWKTILNLFPDIPEKDEERGDDDDTWIDLSFQDRIENNLLSTEKAIKNNEDIIYQPGFRFENCYVRADYMIRNTSWGYDLYEVKAKSNVRKSVKNNWEDENIGEIEKCFIYDLSFQKCVINEVFKLWWIPFIEKTFICHLNSSYVKHWSISIQDIVKVEEAGLYTKINVIQWWSRARERTIDIDDTLLSPSVVMEIVKLIQDECLLKEDKFNEIHIFTGSKYLEYFGKDKPFWTIYSPRYSSTAIVSEYHYKGIIELEKLWEDEIINFGNRASEFIFKYLKTEREPLINKEEIKNRLSTLIFPICFYDYESTSVPIPILDWTSPYQQSVVQYSLHKLYKDWKIEHFWAILSEESDKLQIIDIPDIAEKEGFAAQKNRYVIWKQEDLFRLFLSDIGKDIETSSFVVWYDPFENSRNKEIWKSFWEFENAFLKINEKTFDLYKIFADLLYFDRGFLGSASIKKVLPVLVPSLSYDNLKIGKWDKAMQALQYLLEGRITDKEIRLDTIKNLLIYCRQDSFAMLAIYKILLSII